MIERTLKGLAAGLLFTGLLALTPQARPSGAQPPAVGRPAPNFALMDLGGKTHSLRDYRGQVTVVGFISTTCPISNAYHERLRALVDEFKRRNVAFLGINANQPETVGEIREHAARQGLDFTILKDADGRVADAFGAERTPEVYVIDAQGVLRYHGRIDNSHEPARVKRSDLREALNELLAGQPVSVPEAKAFGCLIKRAQGKSAQASKAPAAAEPAIVMLKPADFPKLKEQSKGKVLLINFWATWCGPCVAEFPEFVAIDEKYRARGVRLVAISADEAGDIQTKVIPFLKEMKAGFEAFVQDTDDPQEMIDQVHKEWSGALPATFIYDRQGKMTYQRFGIIDRELLVAALESALKP